MAARTFARTSRYDAMISAQWTEEQSFPKDLDLQPQKELRYGENPHQKAVWAGQWNNQWKVLQGKELSYNNLLDTDNASIIAAPIVLFRLL